MPVPDPGHVPLGVVDRPTEPVSEELAEFISLNELLSEHILDTLPLYVMYNSIWMVPNLFRHPSIVIYGYGIQRRAVYYKHLPIAEYRM